MRALLPNGSSPVYPGHAITTAWFIVNKYPSFEPGHAYCNALEDTDIPGAGSEVVMALDFLRKLVDGEPWDEVVRWADEH
jgi:hypothetical protein